MLNICEQSCATNEHCPGRCISGAVSGCKGVGEPALVQELEARRTAQAPSRRGQQTCQQTLDTITGTFRGHPHTVGKLSSSSSTWAKSGWTEAMTIAASSRKNQRAASHTPAFRLASTDTRVTEGKFAERVQGRCRPRANYNCRQQFPTLDPHPLNAIRLHIPQQWEAALRDGTAAVWDESCVPADLLTRY